MAKEIKGIVTCIRHRAGLSGDDYFIVAEEGGALSTLPLKSGTLLNIGEFMKFSVEEGAVKGAWPAEDGKDLARIRAIIDEREEDLRSDRYRTGIDEVDGITSRMWEPLSRAASLLLRKLAVAAPITVRFHNDIDGACGAFCLNKAMADAVSKTGKDGYSPNIHWRMHGGVSYGRIEATSDTLVMNNYECIEKPLLVILDFGTAKESNPGVDLVRDRFDIIWLDHHPMVDGFQGRELSHYVNPWLFGGDSNYTAGFLTCAFSKTFADVDSRDIENASFIGDYSTYARPDEGSRRLAALLDLITSDTKLVNGSGGDSLDPAQIEAMLNDGKRSADLIAFAENRVAEMLDTALRSVKVYSGSEAKIYVADFETLRGEEGHRYPLPGRFASKLLDRIEELNTAPCILLLHFKSFISIRMSKRLSDSVGLLEVLAKVGEEHPDDVDSSGGHSNAASIKLRGDSSKKEIIKAVVDKLKERA